MKTTKFLIIFSLSIAINIFSQTGWTKLNSGTNEILRSLYFNNTNTGYAAGENGKIIKTTNSGVNWISLNAGAAGILWSVSFIDNNTGFIAGYEGSYRTTNGGANWLRIPLLNWRYKIQFANPLTGYSPGAGNQVMKTTNGGLNWESKYVNTSASFYNVSVVNENTAYFCPGINKLFKTIDGGDSWQQINTPYGGLPFSIFFVNDSTGYLVTEGGGRYLLSKTTNGGINWTTQLSSIEMSFGGIYMLNDQTGFVEGCSWNPGYTGFIFKTTNGGINWNKSCYIDNAINCIYFVNENTGYAAGFDGMILKTTNGGELTTHSISGTVRFQDNSQPVFSGKVKAVKFYPQSNQTITLDSAIIQSNGTYTLPFVPQDSVDIMAFQDDEDNAAFVPTYYVSTIYWQNSTTLFPDTNMTGIDIFVYRNTYGDENFHIGGMINTSSMSMTGISGAIVYAKSGNIFKGYSVSSNTGNYRIDKLSSGSYDIIVDRMGYISNHLPAQINNSSIDNFNFTLQNHLIGVDPPGGKVPETFYLGQNYPNPFNPATKISFSIPFSRGVEGVLLIVYDLLGREVTTLVNEELRPGKYEVTFDGTKFSSGVYYYKLIAGEFTDTKRMVLVK